jgi:hypothetical protein
LRYPYTRFSFRKGIKEVSFKLIIIGVKSMKIGSLLIAFLIFSLVISSVNASIAWNGEEWLIGWGGVNDYTQKRLERNIDLVLLKDENFAFIPLGRDYWPASMGDVHWAKDYWLVTYYPEPHPSLKLAKYDGINFTILSPVMVDANIVWNGEYFLIGGRVQKSPGKWSPALLKYDGKNIAQLDFNGSVSKIGWNGEYWLIVESVLNETINESYSRLIEYNEADFIDLGMLEFSNIYHIAWNGEYWLIVGDEQERAKLVKYDGKNFDDLSTFIEESRHISDVKWNGKYWLIGGDKGILKKYDGSFTDLTNEGKFDREGSINKIAWNGDYWLITSWYSPKIKKYDGKTFTDLTPALRKIVRPLGYREMAWNGEYWLIEVEGSTTASPGWTYSLIKYDGHAFTELTKQPKTGNKLSWMLVVLGIIVIFAAISFMRSRRS